MWTTLTTAGALVVDAGRLLLVRQQRPSGFRWEVPGGYHDPGESLEQCAAREVEEETGVPVEIGALACTWIWQRASNERRNLCAYFAATPRERGLEPRPQTEEGVEDAAFVDPGTVEPDELHPLTRAVLERWWPQRSAAPFHLFADVVENDDGSVGYVFR